MTGKRKVEALNSTKDILNSEVQLFVDQPADDESGEDDEGSDDVSGSEEDAGSKEGSGSEDSADSDSSEYSGLEEEADTTDSESSEDDEIVINTKHGMNLNVEPGKGSADPPDEYVEDSSDEEDIRNTVGNVPMEWYKSYKHIGYDVEGRKLIKPEQGDQLDDFLNKVDDPNYWRTVHNKLTGQNIVLSKDDVKLIQNLQKKQHPTGSEDQYAPWIDWFSSEVMIHPLSNRPEHKRSFVPSKWEKLKVGQMVHALKMGWMKPTKTDEDKDEDEEEQDNFYMIWNDDEQPELNKRYRQHIPAPKLVLPGHAESYNPPPEYLFNKQEEEKWRNQEPEDRRINFIPQKFSSLRSVPGYSRFINERFERCLDLYLCPRQRKMRMNVDPEDLIPKLPKPKDLQPFPTTQSIVYKGHSDMVRCISVDPSGQWLVSGSDDKTVRVWEVATGRCMKTITVQDKIKCITWNPNPAVCLVALVMEKDVVLLNPGVGDKLQVSNTDSMLQSHSVPQDQSSDSKVPVSWSVYEGKQYEDGFRIKIAHSFEVSQVTWHAKGDYFATVMPKAESRSVMIHQLSKRRSQNPFSKTKGIVQCVRFHPVRPFLFVATQRFVRVYNLLKQELSKKLMTNCKWVSSMAVHPEGDNVIIGSYDSRLSWFDMDLSTKPYQTLKHHKKAIRQVCYHRRYPLFASASDDCSLIVCHGMVYNDLLQNPLIVPVKVLRGHTSERDVGILDCVFHPSQPWLFSAGADATIRLYT